LQNSGTRETALPAASYSQTSPARVAKRMNFSSGDHSSSARRLSSSLPHSRLPSTPPTMTAPSSYAMAIFSPLLVHFMSRATLLLLRRCGSSVGRG